MTGGAATGGAATGDAVTDGAATGGAATDHCNEIIVFQFQLARSLAR